MAALFNWQAAIVVFYLPFFIATFSLACFNWVEHAFIDGETVNVTRPVAPGAHVTFAGTDIARGERVRSIEMTLPNSPGYVLFQLDALPEDRWV